jgi:hypothetical protein
MVEAKTHCYGWRQTRQDNKKLGRNRGIPKTQRVLASTNRGIPKTQRVLASTNNVVLSVLHLLQGMKWRDCLSVMF